MAALDAHADQALAVAMRRSRVEVTRTAESTVAVLYPVAVKTPFSLWHVTLPLKTGSSNPLRHFQPAGRPPSIPESHPRAAAPDSPGVAAARPPRRKGRTRDRGSKRLPRGAAAAPPAGAPIAPTEH